MNYCKLQEQKTFYASQYEQTTERILLLGVLYTITLINWLIHYLISEVHKTLFASGILAYMSL